MTKIYRNEVVSAMAEPPFYCRAKGYLMAAHACIYCWTRSQDGKKGAPVSREECRKRNQPFTMAGAKAALSRIRGTEVANV